MILNKGFIFRWGQRIKDIGELIAHVRVFGIRILWFVSGPLIGWGNRIMVSVLGSPVRDI